MSKVIIYSNFAGLHINAKISEELHSEILDVAKVQVSNSTDFENKFNMVEKILDDTDTEWIQLTFIPDWNRVTECDFKYKQIFMPKYNKTICKGGVNTFIWARFSSDAYRVRQSFMKTALSSTLRYNVRTLNDLNGMRIYLREFKSKFFEAMNGGIFLHGELTGVTTVRPHMFTSSDHSSVIYEECKWLEGDELEYTYSSYTTSTGVPGYMDSYFPVTTADTGTRRK